MNETPNASALGILIVIGATVSISLSNIFSPLVYEVGSNPQTLTFFRFACFSLVCGAWLRLSGTPMALPLRDRLHCAGSGIVYTLASGSLIAAFAFIPVSLAVLILYMFPLLTRLGEAVLDRRPPATAEIACFIVALVGLGFCLGVGFAQLNLTGLLFAGFAAVGVTVSLLWNGRKLAERQPTLITFYMAVTGAVAALVFTTATGGFAPPPPQTLAIAAVAGAALTFAGGFLGMFSGVRIIGASRTAMVMNLEPVVTIALALLILGEDLSLSQFAGAALVIAAITVAQALPAAKSAQGR